MLPVGQKLQLNCTITDRMPLNTHDYTSGETRGWLSSHLKCHWLCLYSLFKWLQHQRNRKRPLCLFMRCKRPGRPWTRSHVESLQLWIIIQTDFIIKNHHDSAHRITRCRSLLAPNRGSGSVAQRCVSLPASWCTCMRQRAHAAHRYSKYRMCLCAGVNGYHHPADSPEDGLISCPPGDIFAYFMNSLTFNVSTTGSYTKGGGERGERLILTKELPTESICTQKIPLIDTAGFNVAGSTGNVRYPPRTDSWEASPLNKSFIWALSNTGARSPHFINQIWSTSLSLSLSQVDVSKQQVVKGFKLMRLVWSCGKC